MEKTLKDERTTFVDRNKVITEEKDVIKKLEDHFENSFFDKFSILRSLWKLSQQLTRGIFSGISA